MSAVAWLNKLVVWLLVARPWKSDSNPPTQLAELVIVAPLPTADETIDFHRNAGGRQRSRCYAKGLKARKGATLAVAVATLLLLLQVPPAFKPVHCGGGT